MAPVIPFVMAVEENPMAGKLRELLNYVVRCRRRVRETHLSGRIRQFNESNHPDEIAERERESSSPQRNCQNKYSEQLAHGRGSDTCCCGTITWERRKATREEHICCFGYSKTLNGIFIVSGLWEMFSESLFYETNLSFSSLSCFMT